MIFARANRQASSSSVAAGHSSSAPVAALAKLAAENTVTPAQLAVVEQAMPAAAGARYPQAMMAHLDSER